jgi:hypothetical protein
LQLVVHLLNVLKFSLQVEQVRNYKCLVWD